MTLPDLDKPSSDYRYGFQGQEKDDELKGPGNSLNYTFRMHDPRVGRFFATDPLAYSYPYNSPYAFSENDVISHVELEGGEKKDAVNKALTPTVVTGTIGKDITKELAKEAAKNVVEGQGKQLIVKEATKEAAKNIAGKAFGTIFMFFIDYMSPNYGGNTSEMDMYRARSGEPKPMPLVLPEPAPTPSPKPSTPKTKPKEEEEDYVTLFRGVSSDYSTKIKRDMYSDAKLGMAVPNGLRETFTGDAHISPYLHTTGNNNSLYTSWTTDYSTAYKFGMGPKGKFPGIILKKTFKRSEVFPNLNPLANKLDESEWLAIGIVTGAEKIKLKKVKE